MHFCIKNLPLILFLSFSELEILDLRNQEEEEDLSQIFGGFQAESDSCSTSGNICCKVDRIIKSEPGPTQQPPIIADVISDKCEDFANDGFKCVEKFRCLDDAFGWVLE